MSQWYGRSREKRDNFCGLRKRKCHKLVYNTNILYSVYINNTSRIIVWHCFANNLFALIIWIVSLKVNRKLKLKYKKKIQKSKIFSQRKYHRKKILVSKRKKNSLNYLTVINLALHWLRFVSFFTFNFGLLYLLLELFN